MKRTILIIILAVTIAVFALVSCRSGKKEPAVPAAVPETAVKTYRLARQNVAETITYTGTLEALKKTSITPENGGKVAKILVREGDAVRQGQVLAELETESIRLQLQQAEAGVAVAEAARKDALKNKERMDRLIKENAVSEQQREQVLLAFDSADAQFRQARAALDLARHALDVSIMKAPWSGIIASKNVEVGDVINPMMGNYSAASGVLTLMDFTKVKIVIDVTQNDIPRIRRGQAVVLRTPAAPPGREFAGEVSLVNLAADSATKKFRVETQFDNSGLELRPGTFGDVTFEVSRREGVLALPQRAILDNDHVFVAEGGKAVRKNVTLGLQNTVQVEILSGISEGDLVIVEGNYGLEENEAVRIEEEVKR
jgi:RND family efflux transporter MFP subunit